MLALRIVCLCFTIVTFGTVACADEVSRRVETSPERVGRAIVDDLLARDDFMMYVSDHFTGIHYAEAAAAYGALKFLQLDGDSQRLKQVSARYQDTPGTEDLLSARHVDASVYGIVPLQLFLLDGDESDLQEGLALADAQWADAGPDGLSPQTRYWIDDIWMVNSLQVQAFRATGDAGYLDRAALQTAAYLDRLQQQNGLFFHGPEAPFADAYRHAWDALVQRIDQDGRLMDVCVGTGQSKEVSYYLERPKTSGDFHGQAPMLWFAAMLLAHPGAVKETAH